MGFHHSTYIAYGAEIMSMDQELLERVLKDSPVSFLVACMYGPNVTFLVTRNSSYEIQPGEYRVFHPALLLDDTIAEQDAAIEAAAKKLGVPLRSPIGWIAVHDLD